MNPRVGHDLAIAAAAALLLAALVPFGERIPAGYGLGYDGLLYFEVARNAGFREVLAGLAGGGVAEPALDPYLAHRILLPLLAHEILGALGVPVGVASVVAFFTWANVLLTAVAAGLWARAADALGLSAGQKWLGASLLVASYACWKMPIYYPVLTDSAALAFGSASLLLFLQRRTAWLAALGFAGAFAWPSFAGFTALLVAFPRTGDTEIAPAPGRVAAGVAAAAALCAAAAAVWLVASGYTIRATPIRPVRALLPASAAFTGAVLYFGLRRLLDSRALWRSLAPRRLLASPWTWLAGAMLVASEVAVRVLGPNPTPEGAGAFALDTFYTSVTQPGSALLAHALYFGPLLLFLPFAWSRLCSAVQRQGTGLVLCTALALGIAVGSESRKLINFLPFATLFLVAALDGVVTTARQRWGLAALAVVFSKVWLPMDHTLRLPFLRPISWRTLYMSSRGPWIDDTWYAIQLVPVLAVLVWFGVWWRRAMRDHPASAGNWVRR